MRYKAILVLLLAAMNVMAQGPKREFRGAWIQCVNGQFQGMSRDQMQGNLTWQLDELQRDGINAIFFQVRPEGDALYQSQLEPWSRYLTGTQGVAPNPYWDPLQWMVEQCHRRGMELHAWINPFRAKTKTTPAQTSTYYREHPDRFFNYDGLMLFDPAIPENRAYICHVACDIVRRYDVDGLHIDDYFYPYPTPGEAIPDDANYQRYGNGMDRADWRRYNVNCFIHDLNDSVRAAKPWVKFGVSPFGIYRNAGNGRPHGSNTRGLQNYDDLYADVLEWLRQGWIDYNLPQVYWEIGHATADYETLVKWWNDYTYGRHLYIGQDVERTVKKADQHNPATHQMQAKYALQRSMPNVQGSCQWYSRAVVDNIGNYGKMLELVYHRNPALQPLMPWKGDSRAPKKVKKVREILVGADRLLCWTAPKARRATDEAARYAIYRFEKGEAIDLQNPDRIVAITGECFYRLPATFTATKYRYVVTAIDRLGNESRGSKRTVML